MIAEQSFSWTNTHRNTRVYFVSLVTFLIFLLIQAMNGERFLHFWHYLLDLHNLKVISRFLQLTKEHPFNNWPNEKTIFFKFINYLVILKVKKHR